MESAPDDKNPEHASGHGITFWGDILKLIKKNFNNETVAS